MYHGNPDKARLVKLAESSNPISLLVASEMVVYLPEKEINLIMRHLRQKIKVIRMVKAVARERRKEYA